MNFYKHHIGDYRRDTGHLSLLEHGAYRQLLDTYYLNEEPIPPDVENVLRRLCARSEDERSAVLVVLREFFIETADGWIHGRCDAEITEYHAKAEVSRTNGRAGVRRQAAQQNPDGILTGTQRAPTGVKPAPQDDPAGGQNHEPVTNKPRTKKPQAPAVPDGFDRFWSAYPRKIARATAEQAWCKVAPDEALAATILSGLERAKRSRDWTKDGGQFVPHPTTWLSQRRWEDEISESSSDEIDWGLEKAL